ncbi:hypothetical protein DND62_07170 [Pseudomonas syringae pv. pisi]|uniref:hypothetical protein n=1 Tax=Pseudomonas syringae TaxID=317 RepID=UPI000BB64AFB|nr:hypothetical protein [Pseudomonas syringae]PBP63347.1 hypothetical protein CCL21_27465 [Pseudomonas syringae]PYD15912.1 hypothetical protein DND62_07170 [Pseudomonas syringae pv. pisi]
MANNAEIPEGTPLIMAASAPLKLFCKDGRDRWNPTLDQINTNTYDHLKLSRVSGFIDGNVRPYSMLVGFDGTLALPALPEFTQRDKALKIFNRVLLEMLLGGIYTEAAAPEDIFPGLLYNTGYIRIHSPPGNTGSLHYALRDRSGSSLQSISLLDRKPITISKLEKAVKLGRKIVSKCDPLSHEIVLAGCTHYVSGALAEALTCLWTSIEQLVSQLWRIEIEEKASADGVPQRTGFLKDYRVWTTSARIELLFQKGIINAELYCSLNDARKARNNFIHRGDQPDLSAATAALSALFFLMSLCTTDYADIHVLDDVRARIEARCILKPRPQGPIPSGQVKYWRNITPIPGEKNFKGRFTPFNLQFQPIETFDAKRAKRAEMQKARPTELNQSSGDADDTI